MMDSLTGQLLCRIVVILAMTSSISADSPTNKENDTNVYDDACFVPSSERPSNENKLVLFDVSLPVENEWNQHKEYLAFTSGTCGVEIYLHYQGLYFDPILSTTIQSVVTNLFSLCTHIETNTNESSSTWHIRVISTGSSQFSQSQSAVLVPLEEVTRLPTSWLKHFVLHLYTDFLAAGRKAILCNVPYLRDVPQSDYNLNFTFQINGCPSGKYGSQCHQYCSCADGVECHSFNGVCMCPTGLQGTSCDQRKPQLIVDKQQVYVAYGDTFNLTCTAHGMTPTAWSWIKDGQATAVLGTSSTEVMVSYNPRPTVISAELTAQNTSISGGYVCEVLDEIGTIYTQRVSVTVIAVPNPFIQVPQNNTALTGSNVTFTCVIRTNAGTVRWVKGYKNQPFTKTAVIRDQIGQYEVKQLAVGVSQLHIYGVEFEDEDVYRCFVGYIFRAPDLNFAEATLIVQSDPQPECSFRSIINVQAGETLTLHCSMKQAKPAPGLAWSIESRDVIPRPVTTTVLSVDNHSWNLNTSLTFVPVPEDDGKQVSLSVVSPASNGRREVRASLNVTYMPIVTVTPDPVTLNQGQDATIRCSAQANPLPFSYVWILRHPSKTSKNVFGNGSTYTIEKVSKEYDKANLTCLVGNAVGESKMTVLIKVTDQASSTGVTVGFSVSGGLCIVVLVLASCLIHRYRKEINLWRAKKAGKNKDDKMYDVFISYKSGGPDEEFVVGSLIPRLERDGYRICVHYKSFVPGKSIIDNIADAVHWSRKTLLLLSPSFVESEWCRYEFQAALSEMLHLQSDLIPIIFEDLGPQENLSSDLQTILRTLSYIPWPNAANHNDQNGMEEERFWRLLWQTLPDTPLEQEGQVPDETLQGGEDNVYELGSGREELLRNGTKEHVHEIPYATENVV